MPKTLALLALALPLVSADPLAQRGKPTFKETSRPFVVDPCFDSSSLRESDLVWW